MIFILHLLVVGTYCRDSNYAVEIAWNEELEYLGLNLNLIIYQSGDLINCLSSLTL